MLERIVKFFPAFDKRHPDPKQNYGIHGVELLMVVKGEDGAVQFKLFTNWMLPHVTKEQDKKFVAKPDRYWVACVLPPHACRPWLS